VVKGKEKSPRVASPTRRKENGEGDKNTFEGESDGQTN
jgi:hypothetical protein